MTFLYWRLDYHQHFAQIRVMMIENSKRWLIKAGKGQIKRFLTSSKQLTLTSLQPSSLDASWTFPGGEKTTTISNVTFLIRLFLQHHKKEGGGERDRGI